MANNEDYDDDLTPEEAAILNGREETDDKEGGDDTKDTGDSDGNDDDDDGSGDDKAGETDKDKDDKPADKAGDDEPPSVAEADDKPGEGGNQDQGQTGQDTAIDDDDEDTPDDFVPVVAAALPTLSKTELDTLNGKLKALDEEFDEGEMSTRVYVSRREEIREKINAHESAIKLNAANVDANWRGAQAYFLRQNPVFKSNSIIEAAFQNKVNALIADPSSNSMSDMEILNKCRKELISELRKDGIVVPGIAKSKADKAEDAKNAKADKAKAIKDAKKAKADKKGEDLSDVPADSSMDGETWMDKIDKLAKAGKGDEYEEAIENLSPQEYERYMARR